MPGVRIAVTSSFSGKGFAAGSAQLDKLNAQAERSTSRISAGLTNVSKSLEATSKRMGAAGDFMVKRATLPIVAALGLATKAAIDDQKSQALLANTVRNSVGPSDAARASVEKSITAWQDSYGIIADKLRPAYGNLIRATHSVAGANALMTTAINVSAARHLDLEKVTLALSKAQNGNVAGLAKLGVKTKDAAGHTMSFKKIVEGLNSTFAGAGATAANTAAGKLEVLKARFHDLTVQVGNVLLPVVEAIVTRVSEFVGWVDKLNPSLVKWAVRGLLVVAAIGPLLKIAQLLTAGLSTVFGVLGALSTPVLIVVVAIAALTAGFIYLWRTSDTFRARVRGLWDELIVGVHQARVAWDAFVSAFRGEGVTSNGIVGFAERAGVAVRRVVQWFVWLGGQVRAGIDAFREYMDTGSWTAMGFGERVGVVVAKVVKFFQALPENARRISSEVVAGIRVFVDWLDTYVVPVISNTVGYIVQQFTSFAAFIATRWNDIKQATHNVLVVIAAIIIVVLAAIVTAWKLWGDDIWRYVKRMWDAVRVVIQGAFEIIRGIFDLALALLTGHWSRAWSGLKEILAGVLLLILGAVKAAWAGLQLLFGVGLSALRALWHLAWQEIQAAPGQAFRLAIAATKAGVQIMFGALASLPGMMLGLVGSFVSAAQSIGSSIMHGIISGVTGAISFVGNLAKSLGSAFIGFINDHVIHPVNDAIGAISFSVLGHRIGLPKHLIPDIPGAYTGGEVTRGGLVRVGEHGEEVVDLPTGARIYRHGTGPSTGGHTFNFYGADGSPDELAHAMLWQLRAAG